MSVDGKPKYSRITHMKVRVIFGVAITISINDAPQIILVNLITLHHTLISMIDVLEIDFCLKSNKLTILPLRRRSKYIFLAIYSLNVKKN